jgi:glycosyltransferase involved in cell wall biosynthesis
MNSAAQEKALPRVFVDSVPWDFRSRNTDWRYTRFLMPRLREWEPAMDLVFQSSRRVTIEANYKTIRMAIGRRIGFPLPLRECEVDTLDARELKRSGATMVFSHRGYPVNAGECPVIWQSCILDPIMTMSYLGVGEADLWPESEIRYEMFLRATVVQVQTAAERLRLAETYPAIARRLRNIPPFLPYLSAASEEVLNRHKSPERVEILFVGNDARRKGLDLLIDAFEHLPQTTRRRAHLTIVSHFDGGALPLPKDPDITVLSGIPNTQVLELMRNAHVFASIPRYEAYGFVYLEAMSLGAAVLGPNWEVQREILDNGRAGATSTCDVSSIVRALTRLIEDDSYRMGIATAGWSRFRELYAPSIVAANYAELFQSVAHSL